MKGPIIHKILYRLSREQQRKFLGEETKLNNAIELQSIFDTAWYKKIITPDNFNEFIDISTAALKFDPPSDGIYTLYKDFDWSTYVKQIDSVKPINTQELTEISPVSKRSNLEGRINEVIAEIRALPKHHSENPEGYCSELLTILLDELKGLLDQVVSRQTRHFRRLGSHASYSFSQDLRRRYRNVSAFLFKNLPDFSGSEEEAVFTIAGRKQIASLFNPRIKCTIIQNQYSSRLIPLSNLRMTG